MQMNSSKIFNITELPLKDFVSGNTSWPEDNLRQNHKPAFYITRYSAMGCLGVTFAAPKGGIICVAPSSSGWKHDEGFNPEPIQGGAKQLAWLGEIQRSSEMPRKLKADLKAAGLERAKFRQGMLPYEGGACFGNPPVGVSKKAGADLSPYLFRSYLIPDSNHSLDCFVAEFERLAVSLGSAFIRPIAEEDIWSGHFPTLVHNDYDTDPAFSRDGMLFCQRGERHPTLTSQQEMVALLESNISEVIASTERGSQLDFLDTNPFLVDEAIKLPLPIYDDMSEARLAAMKVEVAQSEERSLARQERRRLMERLCSFRARLIRLVEWPVCYLAAHRGLAAAKQYYRNKSSIDILPYDIETELSEYMKHTEQQYPVLSVSFLESVWELRP